MCARGLSLLIEYLRHHKSILKKIYFPSRSSCKKSISCGHSERTVHSHEMPDTVLLSDFVVQGPQTADSYENRMSTRGSLSDSLWFLSGKSEMITSVLSFFLLSRQSVSRSRLPSLRGHCGSGFFLSEKRRKSKSGTPGTLCVSTNPLSAKFLHNT